MALPPKLTLVLDDAELARLGILPVTTTHYLVGPFRYGSLHEAVAATKRARVAGNDA